MNGLANIEKQLPGNLEDLSKFALVGREKLKAVRAEISAIERVGLAKEVLEQKRTEAQDIAELVTLSEVKIGKMLREIPKATKGTGSNQYKKTSGEIPADGNFSKNKSEVLYEIGLKKNTASAFQKMAEHEDIVREAIAEARENNDIISRSAILSEIKKAEQKAEREMKITEQLQKPKTTNSIDIHSTGKKYRVIYADPPWQYSDRQDTEKLGGAAKHYPTMSLDEICSLPVPAENNAVLFLWTTSPMLEDSFKVINSWGFKYKTSFVWDKISHTMGHYNSVRHEFLLVATRGKCTPDVPKLHDSVVSMERTEHSAKPAIFREIIDEIYPAGERLEMFARESPPGWDVWGNMV